MHSAGTCLLMDEVGALTTSRRCEWEHCAPQAPEMRQLIWKGGESSSQRQDAGEVTTSPGLQACASLSFQPLPYGYLHLAPAPPHPAGGSAESPVGREEESRKASGTRRTAGTGDRGQTLGPQKPTIGTVEVADLLNCRADMRPRQASLPPILSPSTESPTPKVTTGPSQCFLRPYYVPGPWLRCACTLAALAAFFPAQACAL